MGNVLSRRGLLLGGSASVLGVAAPALAIGKPRPLRVAHMTDFHVQPEAGAERGMAKALDHMMALLPRPDLILAGGDLIMDAFAQTEARTKLQWGLFSRLMKDHTNLPSFPVLGNHDVWGWNKKDSQTDGSERLWAKRWFADQFQLSKLYYSFDKGPWHFVVLDNILLTPDGYNGFVEAEQMDWLAQDLATTTKPTLVISHIPILSITSVAEGYSKETGEWNVGGNLMTKNTDDLRALFAKHPHVKVALSGHTHMVDRVDYAGVSYLCGGAVCGAWWNGNNAGFPPGYRIIDLHANGTFTEKYLAWGWTPQ